MNDKLIYFDVSLVRKLQEEVSCGPISTSKFMSKPPVEKTKKMVKVVKGKEKVKAKESKDGTEVTKLKESVWFGKEKLNKLVARLNKVRQLFKKYKDNDKYEREGVSLENEIEELRKKLATKTAGQEVEQPAEVEEAAGETETMPTTKPDIAPAPTTPAPKPKTPITPQPHISPKPKAVNRDVALFAKTREAKRG